MGSNSDTAHVEETMRPTLEGMATHFFRKYGRRDRIYLSSLDKRIKYLSSGIGDLQDAIRKEAEASSIGDALSRVVRRIFCIAEHFKGVDFVGIMAKKYPLSKCTYCKKLPLPVPTNAPQGCTPRSRSSTTKMETPGMVPRFRQIIRRKEQTSRHRKSPQPPLQGIKRIRAASPAG